MHFHALFLLFAVLLPRSNGDVFSSLTALANLVDVEAILIDKLETYIAYQEEKLARMRQTLDAYATEHAVAAADPYEYVSNPVRSFLFVKRLTKDWKTVEAEILSDPSMEAIRNVTTDHGDVKFPEPTDLHGAAVGLVRLQDTYKMDVADIAQGRLNGVQYPGRLNANDCFELGLQMYSRNNFHHAVQWLTESYLQYEEETEKTVDKTLILDYLAYSHYKIGDFENALRYIKELIEIDPRHRAAPNIQLFTEEDGKTAKSNALVPAVSTVDETFATLCRGEGKLPVDIASRLACRYVDYDIPFLKIAPLKEEEAYLDPRVVVFHGVIGDAEIAMVKRLALPRFYRAGVKNHLTGVAEVSEVRVSKVAWLLDSDDRLVDDVSRRTSLMSGGLSRETVESLQVVNYGIGGHYLPHHDFSRKEDPGTQYDDKRVGNRIATVLFYMTDVEQGGATVFPKLGISVFPKKGTATLWWNLHRDNEGDYRTMHAACPVLTGSKWICNKWYHERGQEFIRPCGLEKDSLPDKP